MGISIPPSANGKLAAALSAIERRQATLANNLANVSTVGFKASRTFTSLMADGATPAVDVATDLRSGAVTTTGNALDLAITGDGYFVVRTPGGERLTRAGQFGQNATGELVDGAGHPVLADAPDAAQRRPIRIPAGTQDITVTADGSVLADQTVVGRLAIHGIPVGATVQHEAGGLLASAAPTEAVAESSRAVRQGAIEESNVSSVDALVQMINVQRAYASAQRAMSAIDSARGIAVSEIGKPL
jgi:flagellar basal body rod protein FlgG